MNIYRYIYIINTYISGPEFSLILLARHYWFGHKNLCIFYPRFYRPLGRSLILNQQLSGKNNPFKICK